MAREGLSRGLMAAGDLLGNFAQLQLQNRLIGERQRKLIEAQQAGAKERQATSNFQTTLGQLAPRLQSGDVLPDQAEAQLLAMFPDLDLAGLDLEDLGATEAQAIAAALDPFEEAGSLASLPGSGSTVARDLVLRRPSLAQEPGLSREIPGPPKPAIGEALAFPDLRQDQLEGAEPFQAQPTIGPEGAGQTQFIQPRQAGQAGETFQTERTADQELDRLLGTLLAPEAQEARISEATGRAAAAFPFQRDIAAAQGVDAARLGIFQDTQETGAAVAQFVPQFERIVELSKDLALPNPEDIIDAAGNVMTAGARRLQGAVGLDQRVQDLEQVLDQSIRSLARAMGVQEANVTEMEQEMARRGIGLGAFETEEGRVQALRQLRDIAIVAPLIQSQLPPHVDNATRMDRAQALTQAIREAELTRIAELELLEEAGVSAVGPETFTDPITGNQMRVIR